MGNCYQLTTILTLHILPPKKDRTHSKFLLHNGFFFLGGEFSNFRGILKALIICHYFADTTERGDMG
jgi:hypothetical protein